jgi:hypothetical protein
MPLFKVFVIVQSESVGLLHSMRDLHFVAYNNM